MATKQVYVIKVKSAPPPLSQLLPSERRYSAQGVLGLACVHFALTTLATVLAIVRPHFLPFITIPVMGGVSGCAGMLAWRRWYEGVHIRVFLGISCASFLACLAVEVADLLQARDETVIGAAELHGLLTGAAEVVWSALCVFVAWRGVRNKDESVDDERLHRPSSPLHIALNWPSRDEAKESQRRVLEYLQESSRHHPHPHRPPVEGKEKTLSEDGNPELP